MGMPFDPSMLMANMPNVAPGMDANAKDPVVSMFINSMQGPAAQQTPQAAPQQAAPSGPPAAPVPIGNPAASGQPGLFKRLLMNFAYSGAQALNKQLGLPTDQELRAQQQAETDRQQQMALATRRQQAEETNQASEATLRAAQIAKIQHELEDPGAETPTEEFTRRKAEGASLGLQGDDLIRYVLKQAPATEKAKPNVNDAQLALDAANPDPRISGPAKIALQNLANYKAASKGKGETGPPPDPTPYINLFKQGQMSMDGLNKLFPGKDYAPFRAAVILGANQQGVDLNKPLTQGAETQVAAIQGALDDVNESIALIDRNKLDKDYTPWLVSHPGEIAKYKLGMVPESEYGKHMASMSLGRVKQAGMVLNKSSRAWAALHQAMEHTPDIKYSPGANKMRLNDIKQALENSLKELRTTGTRSGLPAQTSAPDPWGIR